MSEQRILEQAAVQAAVAQMEQLATPTLLLSAVVFTATVSLLAAFALGLVSLWLATLFLAVLTYVAYTPLHEAVHSNVASGSLTSKRLNNGVGYAMAQIMGIPFSSHRKEHLHHHRHTNTVNDPDFHMRDWLRSPLAFVRTILTEIKTQNTFVVSPASVAEIALGLSWRAVFVWATGWQGLAVVLIGWFFGALLTVLLFSYLPHLPYRDSERFRNTNIMLAPGLSIVMLAQNYHAIHHLYPRVPFYRYSAVFREAEALLRERQTPIREFTFR
ncbi:MAG: fatty acid desaturase [Pseudomonadota bacterium]